METKQRSGFTLLGFSKAGFGACSHFNECQMGRFECYYAELDPEVKECCACYKRQHNHKTKEVSNLSPQTKEEESELDLTSDVEQLSLSLF